MKKHNGTILAFGLLMVGVALLLTASFNPAAYPTRYSSYSSGTTGVKSGVIVGSGPALLTGLEFANQNAAARNLLVFDLASTNCPPADQTSTASNPFLVFIYNCAATSMCTWGMNGPDAPQGGGGVVFTNGICWETSTTFPNNTKGAADATVNASYRTISGVGS